MRHGSSGNRLAAFARREDAPFAGAKGDNNARRSQPHRQNSEASKYSFVAIVVVEGIKRLKPMRPRAFRRPV